MVVFFLNFIHLSSFFFILHPFLLFVSQLPEKLTTCKVRIKQGWTTPLHGLIWHRQFVEHSEGSSKIELRVGRINRNTTKLVVKGILLLNKNYSFAKTTKHFELSLRSDSCSKTTISSSVFLWIDFISSSVTHEILIPHDWFQLFHEIHNFLLI